MLLRFEVKDKDLKSEGNDKDLQQYTGLRSKE